MLLDANAFLDSSMTAMEAVLWPLSTSVLIVAIRID